MQEENVRELADAKTLERALQEGIRQAEAVFFATLGNFSKDDPRQPVVYHCSFGRTDRVTQTVLQSWSLRLGALHRAWSYRPDIGKGIHSVDGFRMVARWPYSNEQLEAVVANFTDDHGQPHFLAIRTLLTMSVILKSKKPIALAVRKKEEQA